MGVVTQHYQNSVLGHVYVLVKPTARSIRARWRGSVLNVTCPPVSAAELERVLAEMAPKLLAVKPKPRFYVGQVLEFELFRVELAEQRIKPGALTLKSHENIYTFGVGSDLNLSTEEGEKLIDKGLCHVASVYAKRQLLAEANQIADRLGVRPPQGFEIGRGRRTLGCCKGARRIILSYVLMFMPYRLRELVICHELAHLKHMDHSPRFHALVNKYTNNSEARLEAELRAFKFPVSR